MKHTTTASAFAAILAAATCLFSGCRAPAATAPQPTAAAAPTAPASYGEAYKRAQELRSAGKKDEAAAMAQTAADLAAKPDEKAQALWLKGDIYWSRNPSPVHEQYALEAQAVEGISPARRTALVKDIMGKIHSAQGTNGLVKARALAAATLAHPSMSNATYRIQVAAAAAAVEFENILLDDARARLAAVGKEAALSPADAAQLLFAQADLERKAGDYAAARAFLKKIYDDKAVAGNTRLNALMTALDLLQGDNLRGEALALAQKHLADTGEGAIKDGGKDRRLTEAIVKMEIAEGRFDKARAAIAAYDARKPKDDERAAEAIARDAARLTYSVDFAEGRFEVCRKAILANPEARKGAAEVRELANVFFNRGEYAKSAELSEIFWNVKAVPWNAHRELRNVVVAYVRAGNPKGAAAFLARLADTIEKEPKTEAKLLGMRIAAKFFETGRLSQGDARALAAKAAPGVAKGAYEEAARILVAAGRIDEPRMLDDMRNALLVRHRRNIAPTRYVKDAPTDVGSWRASGLCTEKTRNVCDVKFGKKNAERLITDVAVVRGEGVNASGDGADDRPVAWFWVCYDEYGIHLLFEHRDPKFDEVQLGRTGANGYEMYFAVDDLGPVFQFGINPKLKTFEYSPPWNSPHKYFRRLEKYADFTSRPSGEGYATAMNIPWELVYDRLPENGSEWPFEMICWSRLGAVTWGGTDIWQRSEWGHWRFEGLTPKVRNAIRRVIVYKAIARFNAQKNFASGGLVGKWKDAELGDPEFFAAELAPLVAKLDAYAAEAKGDVADAVIDRLFKEAVPLWYDFQYEVAARRTRYLERQLTE